MPPRKGAKKKTMAMSGSSKKTTNKKIKKSGVNLRCPSPETERGIRIEDSWGDLAALDQTVGNPAPPSNPDPGQKREQCIKNGNPYPALRKESEEKHKNPAKESKKQEEEVKYDAYGNVAVMPELKKKWVEEEQLKRKTRGSRGGAPKRAHRNDHRVG